MTKQPCSTFHPVVHHPEPLPVFDFTEAFDPDEINRQGWGIGRYDERRVQTMYNNADLYDEARCIHIGIDIWGPAGTPVHAFAPGHVYAVEHHNSPRNYGPTVITEHEVNGATLWALHGHLSKETLEHVRPAMPVESGDVIGWFGEENENGGWPPHLHFQLSRKEPVDGDMPGVVAPMDRDAALNTYPDPRQVLGPLY
ncbi:peptidase M23 [Longibacter salinarum]|uniref:Peptidase M23 n=1 Tax=Longibacter salinarum TaxID=1850348 RepID=A0A2A8D270_9BACT|nr:peptidoglycan DD-metalloendopeptidase family protein [Longibacter salinarum]PEN14738.1 peptidase M23 [Longibacter salinarum]